MKTLSACSKLLAAFFAIGFIFSAVAVLFLFNFERQLFNPEVYKSVFEQEDVYASLPHLAAQQMNESLQYDPCVEETEECQREEQSDPNEGEDEQGGPPAYLKNLTPDQWEHLLSEILPPEWLKTEVESVLDQIFTSLESVETKSEIIISLDQIKDRMTGDQGVEIVLSIIQTQPDCTDEQVNALRQFNRMGGESDQVLLCNPPERVLSEITPLIRESLDEAIGSLPDEIALGGELFGEDATPSDSPLGNFRSSAKQIRRVLRYTPLIPAIFLLLLTVFGVRSFRDLLRWWGVPLLVTGLVALSITLLFSPLFNWGTSTYLIPKVPQYLSNEFVDTGLEIVRSMASSFIRPILIQSGIFTFLGAVLTIGSVLVKPSDLESPFPPIESGSSPLLPPQ
jgi:hypothetical protein